MDGGEVQVIGGFTEGGHIGNGDFVLRVSDTRIHSRKDLESAIATIRIQETEEVEVEIRKHPFGKRNTIPTGQCGWVYLWKNDWHPLWWRGV